MMSRLVCISFKKKKRTSAILILNIQIDVSLVMRKLVFGIFDQVKLKLACTATEAS